MKELIRKLIREGLDNKSSIYKSWKRKNVTLRGISKNPDEFNGGGAMLGDGLYTAALSNKSMAKEYGVLYFVVNAIPTKPKIFNTLNEWEIWFYNNLIFQYSKSKGKDFPDKRDFNEHTTIKDEMIKMGYNGIIIKGREMVNYTPENVKYFRNEDELMNYFNSHQHNISEQFIDGQNMNKGTQIACNTMSVATYKEGLKLIINAIGHPNENPKIWARISKPLNNWKQENDSIGQEVKTLGMSGDSMVDESNTYWTMIQTTICEQGPSFE